MARRLETSGANLVTSVLTTSREELSAISRQLETALTSNAVRIDDIEQKASSASAVVAKAAEALSNAAKSLADSNNQTSMLLAQVKSGSDSMRTASQGFVSAGNTLLGSVEAMRQISEAARVQTQEQQALLMHQRQYTKEVEQLWPQLFETYLSKFRESSDTLARSWSDFHAKISTVSKSVGAEFAENTLALSEAVNKLVELNGARPHSR
jgi:hypothetical protein